MSVSTIFKLIIIKMKYRKIISQNLSGFKKLMNFGFLLFGGGAGWCLLMFLFASCDDMYDKVPDGTLPVTTETSRIFVLSEGLINMNNSTLSMYDFETRETVADYFLVHNREIIVPVDDAVVKVADGQEILVRCGRGYAPLTIPIETENKVLAVGAEQKCSLCITENGYATVSQYIGDLNEYQTYKVFNRQIKHFKSLFSYCPDLYAYDLNPDYLSTRYAKEQVGKKIAIQHHHAHMAGCMAENKRPEQRLLPFNM